MPADPGRLGVIRMFRDMAEAAGRAGDHKLALTYNLAATKLAIEELGLAINEFAEAAGLPSRT